VRLRKNLVPHPRNRQLLDVGPVHAAGGGLPVGPTHALGPDRQPRSGHTCGVTRLRFVCALSTTSYVREATCEIACPVPFAFPAAADVVPLLDWLTSPLFEPALRIEIGALTFTCSVLASAFDR